MQCPIFIRKHRLTILGGLLGGVGGYLYYHFVGCASGTCPITSSPFLSTLWGILLGGLFFNNFEKKPVQKNLSDSDKTAE
jgi:tetrahydromethanopterin S-methyltransferase subunit D